MGARLAACGGILVNVESVFDTSGLYERTFTTVARICEGEDAASQVQVKRVDLTVARRTTLRLTLVKHEASGQEEAYDLTQITAVKLALTRQLSYGETAPEGEAVPALTLTATIEAPASSGLVAFLFTEALLPVSLRGTFTAEVYAEVGSGEAVQRGTIASFMVRVV